MVPLRTLRRAALGAAWASLLAGVAATGISIATACHGQYIYGTDDAYIHLAMARNIAEHGTYGVSPGVFSSASSSPLWTLGLALLVALLPGALEVWAPLLLGVLSGAAVLAVLVRRVIPSEGETTRWQGAVALALAAATPWMLGLVALAWHGLEHSLHMAVTMLIAAEVERVLSRERAPLRLWLLCAGSVLVRFESAAPAAAVFLLAVLLRRWRLAAAMVAAVVLPVAAQGLWSLAHGEHFLPNSVLVKLMIHTVGFSSGDPHPAGAAAAAAQQAPSLLATALDLAAKLLQRWSTNVGYAANGLLTFCAVLVAAAFRLGRQGWHAPAYAPMAVYLVTFVAQTLAVSPSESFLRYVAYLAGLALLVLGGWLAPPLLQPRPLQGRRVLWTAAGAMALLLPFLSEFQRSAHAAAHSNAVYLGHFNQAHFLARHYPTGTVAIEDLGAITWQRDAGAVIDLFGLANSEICRRLIDRSWDAAAVREMMKRHDIQIALVRSVSVPREPARNLGSRPAEWQPMGFLVPEGEAIKPGLSITAFAVRPEAQAQLRAALLAEKAAPLAGTRVVMADDPEGIAALASPLFK